MDIATTAKSSFGLTNGTSHLIKIVNGEQLLIYAIVIMEVYQ